MRLKLSLIPACLAAASLAAAAGCTSNPANSNSANAASSSSSSAPADANSSGQRVTGQPNVAGAASNGAGGASAGTPTAGGSSNAGASKDVDACALLTPDDIKSVQGEAVTETKPSRRDDASIRVSQCFFTTATFNKSVSLEVTTSADGRGARRFWDERFGRAREEASKGEREREREKREREKKKERDADKKKEGARGEEEEEEGALPSPVKGLGEEAYWAASRVNGTLYARKGDSFVRLSLGGAGSDAERLGKAKALAQKALARL